MMQEMGNSRGRAVYEANLPDGFRRPQTDSYPYLFSYYITFIKVLNKYCIVSIAL